MRYATYLREGIKVSFNFSGYYVTADMGFKGLLSFWD